MARTPPEPRDARARRVRRLHGRPGRGWWDHGVARELSRRAVKRARIQLLVLAPLLAGVLLLYGYRRELFGREWDTAARAATAIALVTLGWQLARDVGRSLGPLLFRRLEPGTAGTGGVPIPLLAISG